MQAREHELTFDLSEGNKDLFLVVTFFEVKEEEEEEEEEQGKRVVRRALGDVLFSVLMSCEGETVCETFSRWASTFRLGQN